MNLSETDKELIAEIVEQKLRHYKLIGEPAVGVNEVYGPTLQSDLVENIPQLIKQPAVDVVEPYFNYVLECVERRDGLTIGKMYKPQGFNKFTSDYLVIDDRGVRTWFGLQTFIRHKEAQQKEVEKELSEPKQEERFKPKAAREVYFYISDYGEIMKAEFFNDYLDTERYKIGNCFRTEEAATKAAQAIRETLKNL